MAQNKKRCETIVNIAMQLGEILTEGTVALRYFPTTTVRKVENSVRRVIFEKCVLASFLEFVIENSKLKKN